MLSDGSSTMGFGQIMPILLLVLPLFAACEAYYGNYFIFALIAPTLMYKRLQRKT